MLTTHAAIGPFPPALARKVGRGGGDRCQERRWQLDTKIPPRLFLTRFAMKTGRAIWGRTTSPHSQERFRRAHMPATLSH